MDPSMTQELQHALHTMLHEMREHYVELDEIISRLEARWQEEDGRAPASGSSGSAGYGGRRSEGWTEDARAKVAERMRNYWQARRAQRTLGEESPPKRGRAVKNDHARSTAGWTPQAREEAAQRMRARWAARRAKKQDGER